MPFPTKCWYGLGGPFGLMILLSREGRAGQYGVGELDGLMAFTKH